MVRVIDYAEVSPVRHRLNDKCPTASASNTPSTSAGCSRSKRASRRQSTANGYGVDKSRNASYPTFSHCCPIRLNCNIHKSVIFAPMNLESFRR